jgi:hypothetical protein
MLVPHVLARDRGAEAVHGRVVDIGNLSRCPPLPCTRAQTFPKTIDDHEQFVAGLWSRSSEIHAR